MENGVSFHRYVEMGKRIISSFAQEISVIAGALSEAQQLFNS